MPIWPLAAASLMLAPEPQFTWFRYTDVPVALLMLDRPAFVGIRVTVSPSGRVHSCAVEYSSGIKALDNRTCELTRRRARFRPARWIDGVPAWGVYREPVRYLISERADHLRSTVTPADLVLRLNRLPRGLRSKRYAEVALAVDEHGRIESCGPLDAEQHPRLAALGCDQLLKSFSATPATDERGVLVRSVQTARVSFVPDEVPSGRGPLKTKAAAPFGTAALVRRLGR
jgi:TonB family protein